MKGAQGPRLAGRRLNGEAGSASSAASVMGDYREIFGGFTSSFSIPVLAIPECMDGCEEELAGGLRSSGLNYLEIFGTLDAGSFALSYEEILAMGKGSRDGDDEGDSFQEQTNINHVEGGASELLDEFVVGGLDAFSKTNQISSYFDTEQHDISLRTCQQSLVMDEENDAAQEMENLERDFMGANVDFCENASKNDYEPTVKCQAYDLKQHSRSSSYHSTSSGDTPLSDHTFLTVSDINLRTQPLAVPPPLRVAPKFYMMQGMSKSEPLIPSTVISDMSHQVPHFCRDDASTASVVGMIEAMKQAQTSIKSAKEFIERKQESPQSDLCIRNGWNTILDEEPKHKTKMAQKEAPNPIGGETVLLCGDFEEAISRKVSRSYKLSGEKERSPERNIDKFYERTSDEKSMKTKLFDDEKYIINEDIELSDQLNSYHYFAEESCGKQDQRFRCCGKDDEDDNKAERLNIFSINENKVFAEGQLEKETNVHISIGETSIVFEYDTFSSDEWVPHSIKVENCNANSEFGIKNKFLGPQSPSLPNKNERDVNTEHKTSVEKNIPDERKGVNELSKETSERERKNKEAEQKRKLEEAEQKRKQEEAEQKRKHEEAEQKRKLNEERAKEREKDLIAVNKLTHNASEKLENMAFERVDVEARNKPTSTYQSKINESSSKAFGRSEKVANEAKLRAERAAVERATSEARERAVERVLSEQAFRGARKHADTLNSISKDRNGKDEEDDLKPTSDLSDATAEFKSHNEGGEGELPLRCKARQDRCRRMVERAAKALAEMNMRDLLVQREQAERNRLSESLDAEVRRWSTGKEGNLRALLSTLQYILGHDGGWQPIPLTEVITAAGVKKAYRKATLHVHPDKLQQRGASIQHKYVCEKVFDLLKDAWNKFNSEG